MWHGGCRTRRRGARPRPLQEEPARTTSFSQKNGKAGHGGCKAPCGQAALPVRAVGQNDSASAKWEGGGEQGAAQIRAAGQNDRRRMHNGVGGARRSQGAAGHGPGPSRPPARAVSQDDRRLRCNGWGGGGRRSQGTAGHRRPGPAPPSHKSSEPERFRLLTKRG